VAIREYECPEHGRFEVWLDISEPIPECYECRKCLDATDGKGCHFCPWRPSKPGLIKVEGGTTKG
jgi:hypothetical protein